MSTARTFAFYVDARKPIYTSQLLFSDKPTLKEAEAQVLATFDRDFPTAKDRYVRKAMSYSEYLTEVERADRLNYYMSI